MKRVLTNAAAAECVRHKTPFANRSGLLRGVQYTHPHTCDVARYVVLSSRAPIYIFDFTAQRWVGNSTVWADVQIVNNYKKVLTTMARHMREVMPVKMQDMAWANHIEMDGVHAEGLAALVTHRIVQAAS